MGFPSHIQDMKVSIERPDGSRITLFGVGDFQVEEDEVIVFWPPSSNAPQQEEAFEGEVTGAVDESNREVDLMADSIWGASSVGDVRVVLSEDYPNLHIVVDKLPEETDIEIIR